MLTMAPVKQILLIVLTQTFLSFHEPRALHVVATNWQFHPRYNRLLL